MPQANAVDIDALSRVIASVSYDITSEASLQRGIAERMVALGLAFDQEVILSGRDRIDFMVGSVGVEVKVGGGRSAVLRQVHRYAAHDCVSGVLIVTTVPTWASLPSEVMGKPLRVALLSSCLF